MKRFNARQAFRKPVNAFKQKGASALEYMILAAAIIVILGVLSTNDTVKDAVESAFESVFSQAESEITGE
ncbi:hypothetical protein DET50_12453 [Marinobacter pelagius]|uniref:Uncharacterized protein n=1 Tax=Marinobacter pelagius TaxID=379482 RepID=A0A366GFI4_9GAMM|nr:Flp family type IVb pilin [Marinobacter pelagius]RBP25060.1 hypothetical protein DET50_12453 [Marinobacter pelagius]